MRATSRLRAALCQYFSASNLPADGGYSKKWDVRKLGPIRIPIYNGEARRQALAIHDLHHVLTGYTTDLVGEAEVGAWELAGGCSDKWVAWLFKLAAFAIGIGIAPRKTFAAFVNGRRAQNLFSRFV